MHTKLIIARIFKKEIGKSTKYALLFTFSTFIFRYMLAEGGGFKKPETTGKIVSIITIAHQQAAGNVAAHTAETVNINRFIFRKLIEMLTEDIKRNVYKTVNMSAGALKRCADIK